MNASAPHWQGSFTVHAYEMDGRGNLSLLGLCDWLQEAAGRHATALGWSIHDLMARGQTWVLSRLSVRIAHQPPFDAAVTVATWPSGVQRLHSLRDFRVSVGDNEEAAVATTGWILLDLARRRPMRPPVEIDEVSRLGPGRALDDPFEHLPEITGSVDAGVAVTVPWSAIDVNGHANNVRLIEWLLAATPVEPALRAAPASLEVEFRSEARCGDSLRSRWAADPEAPDALLHSLQRIDDGQEVARGRTRWRRGEGAG